MNITDNLKCPESVLVWFDITNMFHNTDNKIRVNSVIRFPDQQVGKESPTQQVIGALGLFLSWNNLVFSNTNYIQIAEVKILILSECDLI